MTLWTVSGLIGVVLVIIAYALLASGRLAASSNRYQAINVAGTAGILLSLIGQWNLPAFIANVAWIGIGLYALLRNARRRQG